MTTLPSTWRYGANLGAPLTAIAYACISQGLPFYSLTPVVIVSLFAVVQACLRFFLLDAVCDHFTASGKERQYWLTLGALYTFLGLGVVQLFTLMSKSA
jgi:hypothetical protein